MRSMPRIAADEAAEMFQLALTYHNQSRCNDAINLCEQILESGFDQPDTHFLLGWLYQEQQRWDEAIDQFLHLHDDPDYALSCEYALGQCRSEQADLHSATVYPDEVVDSVNLSAAKAKLANYLSVVGIYTSPYQGEPMVLQKEITVIEGKGIVGDRYFLDNYSGFFNNHHVPNSERVITLISLEGIEQGNKVMQVIGGTPMKPEETRRNLVASIGVKTLNDLVGQEFEVGPIRMKGVAQSTPCWRPSALAGRPSDLSAFVKAFLNNGGIRAVPLTSGIIHEGDPMVLPH